MIRTVGVIYQDRNSLGFLEGVRRRLNCDATLVDPPAGIGNPRVLPKKQARLAWEYFQKNKVDLVVRLTDADQTPWQSVRTSELKNVPHEANSLWVCGVAVQNLEEWLCLEPSHLVNVLNIPKTELSSAQNRTRVVKKAIAMRRRAEEESSDVVARIVCEAPPEVFRRWLKDDSFRCFYTDCRGAASRENCETPNELDEAEHA